MANSSARPSLVNSASRCTAGSSTSGANIPTPGVSYVRAASSSQISSCLIASTLPAAARLVEPFSAGHDPGGSGTAHLDTEDAVVTLAGIGAAPGGAIGIGRDQPQRPVRREPDRPDAAEITDEVIDRVGCSDAVLDRQLPEPLTAERDESSVAAFSGSNASPVPIQRWPSGIPPPTGRKAAHQ